MDSSTTAGHPGRGVGRGKLSLFVTLLAVLLLGGCASGDDAVGTWGSGGPGLPQLVVEAGGALHGTDGCNVLGGEWRQEGDTIVTDGVISTKMYCEGVDDWLSGIRSARVEGDTLHVFDSSGSEIGTLQGA